MVQTYQSPGVYRQEIFLKSPPALQTGVPAFVGFADPPVVAGSDPASANPTLAASPFFNQPVVLNRKEEFDVHFSNTAGSFLQDAVNGFFDNGGARCYVVAADSGTDRVQGLFKAIAALEPLEDMDLVAVPDAMTLPSSSIARVQQEVLTHCAHQGNRLAILDSQPSAGVQDVLLQRSTLSIGQQEPVNGALYYPWLVTSINPDGTPHLVPPCGHVAGIYALTDGKTGVFKAPANAGITGVLDLEAQIDNSIQDQLNPQGVNCLRAFPGRGIRVWGARTLSNDPNWRYVNVRRLFLTLGRWIDLNLGWTTFEPNNERLWVRIHRELTVYLSKLLDAGALRGASPAEAFYVKCNAENNPPELRDIGQVTIEIGLSPLAPAEFIVVRIIRRATGSPDN
jgi:uncharacterized protein